MIVDIILLALSGAYAAHGVVTFINSKEEVTKLPEKVEEPISDTVQLIVELLREDRGWQIIFEGPETTEYTHESGVVLRKCTSSYIYSISSAIFAYIIQDDGKRKLLNTTSAEDNLLGEELAKLQTRRKDAEQEDLGRLLASRIVSGASVRPLLGDTSGTPEADASNVDFHGRISNNIVSSNYIHFSDGQIIYEKPEDSGEVFLSTELAKRYGLRGTMPERQTR